jgi:hypothetical protein
MHSGGGFNIEAQQPTRTLEMIYTPSSGGNVLFANGSAIFEWSTNGTINKNGIASIYVNGKNVSTETNVFNYFTVSYPHHVVIVLNQNTSGILKINQNLDGTSYGLDSKYNNIAIYPSALSSSQIVKHYDYYIGNWSNDSNQDNLTISESVSGNNGTAYSLYSIELSGSNITI